MSIKIKVKKKFTSRSQRVKSAELHPTEPWMLTSLYDGNVYIWNTETKKVLKSVLVSDLPVRDAKFVPRKNWFITASDDTNIRVFNYNTAEKVAEFSAHRDYIRSLAVHTSRPFLLSCADDGAIRLWDWEKKWACTQTFRGHVHLVMQVTFNPKDYNQFASASMDKSVKIWQLGSAQPNFSLRHDLGVNCLAYYPGVDKPYIVSGCDGGAVKVWDYQTKSCIQTLLGHAKDLYAVEFHPSMPLILSGASDGTVRMWHASTFKMVALLNFDMGRVWSLAVHKVSNNVAIGFDDGSMLIKLGREEPAISMDMSGKIVWAHHSELQQANVKTLQGQEVKDGEKLELAVKDMGSCEIYPQTIAHSPNGRFMSVCGDGEYTIYTAVALRNKAYGSAHEFVWSSDSSVYATRGGNSLITIYRNFKSHKTFKPNTEADGIFGGPLLGVRSSNCLTFYNWDTTELIRRIEITPTQIYWSEGEDLLTLVSDNSFFILKYNSKAVERFTDNKDATTEDGIEDAFEVIAEFKDKLCTGLWVGDCFIFTNSLNRLNYCIGEEIVTISHLDRLMYLLRYIPKDNRLYLGDKELNIVSFSLLVSVLEYQTAVTRRDFDAADKILPAIPREHRNRVAHFLEKQGFKSQALSVSLDLDHKFELALQLEDLTTAHAVAKQQGAPLKWKQLSDLALKTSQLDLALECLHASQDFGGLLLLATSIGNRAMLDGVELAAAAAGQTNVAFTANFVLGRCDKCLQILLDTNRLPEAALFARTYVPSQVPRVVALWRERLSTIHRRLGAAIASPAETENMFPEMLQSLKTERFLTSQGQTMDANTPASRSKYLQGNKNRNPVEEMLIAEASGTFSYNPGTHIPTEDGGDGHKGGDKGSKSEVEAEDRPVEAASPIRNENPAKVSTSTSGETDGEATSHVNSSPSQIPTVETNVTEKSLSDINDPVALDEPKENSHDMSLEKSLTLEEELTRDLEGVDLDDFDMDGFELDSDELLED